MWIQQQVRLRARPRGFHLVTDEIVGGVPDLASLEAGIALVFMQHTSASLTVNENASPDVRRDFAAWFDLCEHRDDGRPRNVLVTAYGCANMRSCAGTT